MLREEITKCKVDGLYIHGSHGMHCPIFVCCHCGEFIEDYENAIVCFEGNDAETLHKKCIIVKGDRALFWMPLDHFLIYLCGNTGIKNKKQFGDIKKLADHFGRW